jgi:hypothetical protein
MEGCVEEGEVEKPEVFVLLFHLMAMSVILILSSSTPVYKANQLHSYNGPFDFLPPPAPIFNTNDKHHADVLLNRPCLCTTCSDKAPS